MTGTITRLVDNRQVGSIAAEDGYVYVFAASALRDVQFHQLSLGMSVSFTPRQTTTERRAEFVRLGPSHYMATVKVMRNTPPPPPATEILKARPKQPRFRKRRT